jgi:sarcosine oxidase subunit alpha
MADGVRLLIDGVEVSVPVGMTVAVALANTGHLAMRSSVGGMPRGPVCGMGMCFECRASIDGRQDVRSCMVACVDGMEGGTGHA